MHPALPLLILVCLVLLALRFARSGQQTTSFQLPAGTVSAPAKGTPGYRTYMRDMRRA